MFFSSGAEIVFIVAFLIIQLIVRNYFAQNIQRLTLFIGNILLLSTIINYTSLTLHSGLSVLAFLTMLWISKTNRNKGVIVAATSILIIITLFVLRNYPKPFGFDTYQIGSSPDMIIQRLGISYILFRNIQSIVDTLKGKFKPTNPIDYINFILFFPNFLAGPIDTFANFKRQFERKEGKIKRALIWPGIGRITLGFVKKYLVIPMFSLYALSYEPFMESMSPQVAIILSTFCYSAYIYLDFSGYSDIAIGTGYIMGIRTPENFNSPYLSTNIATFWKNWHMTFSQFLRDLIFKPIVQLLNKAGLKSFRTLVTIIGYLLTFFICGIWHGDTVNFVYWGLWHAFGLSMYKLWSTSRLHFKLHNSENVIQKNTLTISGMTLTFLFVSMGWLFFHYSGEGLTTAFNLLFGLK